MHQTEQVLLNAIKKALFGIETRFSADTDWQDVLKEAKTQTVVGLVAEGAPAEIRTLWKKEEASTIAAYTRILYAQKELSALLDRSNIRFAVLKGMAAAVYYPNPSARTFGDIDFIVPKEQFDYTLSVLRRNSFVEKKDHDSQRHVCFMKDCVTFELHRYFSSENAELEQHIISGLQRVERRSVNTVEISMLPTLENGMVLLEHIKGHLKSGMGLRQVIDWMMYVRAELDDAFWESVFKKEAEKADLLVLAKTATKMCQRHLGLDSSVTWCIDADESLCDELMDYLLSSGNFGRKYGHDNQVMTVATDIQRIGLFRKLQKSGMANWKAYRKHRWLKPFCWIYQIFRYLKQWFRSRKNIDLFKDRRLAAQRAAMLERLEIH